MPIPTETVERKRAKFIKKEIIQDPSKRYGVTTVVLNPRGRRALKKLTYEEERDMALDLTDGMGYNKERGEIYLSRDRKPVFVQWRKIQRLLNKADKRRITPSEFKLQLKRGERWDTVERSGDKSKILRKYGRYKRGHIKTVRVKEDNKVIHPVPQRRVSR